MKKSFIVEVKKENLRVRVLFVILVFGMGVDVFYVEYVVYIILLSNIEFYVQEIGCVGRIGILFKVIFYYNNFDIGKNKKYVKDLMKEYCKF